MSRNRQRTVGRSLSHGPGSRTSSEASNENEASGQLLPINQNTQLVPYSEWRVILYNRTSGQVVLYNRESEEVEVKPVVNQGLVFPYGDPVQQQLTLPVSQEMALASRPRNRTLDPHASPHVCPMCLRPIAQGSSRLLGPHIDEHIEDAGGASDPTVDRNYFQLLDRSLRLQKSRYVLADRSDTRSSTPRPPGSVDDNINPGRMDVSDASSPLAAMDGEASDATPVVPSSATMDGDGDDDGPSVSANSFNQGYYDRFFSEQKKLGKGLRGSVFSCQHILDNVYLGHYAVKKVPVGNNHKWLQRMLREVKLLESLRHPNVVEYKHSWLEMHQLTSFGPKVPCLFILMEYANGGNLQEYMEPKQPGHDTGDPSSSLRKQLLDMRRKRRLSRVKTMPEQPTEDSLNTDSGPHMLSIEQIWSFFADICNGLAHLHQLQIIHRDLKHMNLLLHWSNPANKGATGEMPRIMLTDFGECEVLSHIEKRNRTGATGTLEFMAPELLEVDATGRYLDSYSTKSDMWSLGMVLYYLCYTQLPFSNIEDLDILRRDVLALRHVDFSQIRRQHNVPEIPSELRVLMQSLLNHDENKRPDITDIQQKVNERRNFWCSRKQDEPRFEIHESEPASSRGDTPGFATPRRYSEADTRRGAEYVDAPYAQSELSSSVTAPRRQPAVNRSPKPSNTGLELVKASNGGYLVVPSGVSTPREGVRRRHSVGVQEHSRELTRALSGLQIQTRQEASAEAKGTAACTAPAPGSKRPLEKHSSDVEDGAPTKRRRAEQSWSDVVFGVKTAVMLLKVYVLHVMASADNAAARTDVPYIVALTLVISAFDIRSESLQLSLVLLATNIGLAYFWMRLHF
ncbi:putative serine/threonine-protein kinase iks1 [Linderina pennispora]|nr:putative serine/threonine-protein kinase iks1 [Linderina pennispora]